MPNSTSVTVGSGQPLPDGVLVSHRHSCNQHSDPVSTCFEGYNYNDSFKQSNLYKQNITAHFCLHPWFSCTQLALYVQLGAPPWVAFSEHQF